MAPFIYFFGCVDVGEREKENIKLNLDHSGNLQVPMAVCFGLLWPSDFDSHSLPLNHYDSPNIHFLLLLGLAVPVQSRP